MNKLTISRVVAALRSARKQSSSSLKNVDWSSIPYTLSKNITMEDL